MKGDGGLGDLLSLGRERRDVGTSGRGDDVSGSFKMLSSLSRNGLTILAGGGGGGGAGFCNLVGGGERASLKLSGSGFSGFYRARPRVECGSEQAAAAPVEQPLRTDVENLSPEECWRLILKLGKRWPAWNGPLVPPSSPPEKSSSSGHDPPQVCQNSLDLLARRALEALAQTPDRHGRPPRSMLAPKMTTQEFLVRTAAVQDPPTPSYQTLPVYVPSVSSMPAPEPGSRTAPLTIFYAGTVSVCENVPEDKARLIMLFAEKAGIKSSAPTSAASPLASGAKPGEDLLQLAQPSSHPAAAASVEPSSSSVLAPSHPSTRPESDANAAAAAAAAAEPVVVPLSVIITEPGRSLQQQGPARPLPNARKNSLARFLDARKRPRPATSGSEDQASKRLNLSDGCPNLGRVNH